MPFQNTYLLIKHKFGFNFGLLVNLGKARRVFQYDSWQVQHISSHP
jgi:hypothetical protein